MSARPAAQKGARTAARPLNGPRARPEGYCAFFLTLVTRFLARLIEPPAVTR